MQRRPMLQRIKVKEILAYLGVSILAIGLAFSISLKVLKGAHSQEPSANPVIEAPVQPQRPAEEMRLEFPDDQSTTGAARSVEVFLEPFIYDEKDRRDPFRAFNQDVGETARTPLQKFNLSNIQLIGIMWDVKNPKAMFVDPLNQVHVLGPDESIGNKDGYIATIREGEVVVVETENTEAGLDYVPRVLKIAR